MSMALRGLLDRWSVHASWSESGRIFSEFRPLLTHLKALWWLDSHKERIPVWGGARWLWTV